MPAPTDDLPMPELPMSDWTALNAYVDGELSAAAAAAMAARIAREPALAQRAAALSKLKAASAAAYDADGVRPLIPAAASPSGPRRGLVATTAAAAVLALAMLALALLPGGRERAPAWLASAGALHAALAALPAGDPAAATPAAESGFRPYIPDLTAARLRQLETVPFQVSEQAAGPGIAVHYRGTRGCKLSYFAFVVAAAADRPDEALRDVRAGESAGYSWRVGDIGYLMIAGAMDTGRLRTLAETVQAASRRYRPLDEPARQRLAESRARSHACAA